MSAISNGHALRPAAHPHEVSARPWKLYLPASAVTPTSWLGQLSPRLFTLMIKLELLCRDRAYCDLSNAFLCHFLGMKRTALKDLLNEAEQAGLIHRRMSESGETVRHAIFLLKRPDENLPVVNLEAERDIMDDIVSRLRRKSGPEGGRKSGPEGGRKSGPRLIDLVERDGLEERDSNFVVVSSREKRQNSTTTTFAALPGEGKPPTTQVVTVEAPPAPELPAGAAEAIAIAAGNPELGAPVADQIRAEASAIGRELEGRWDWFVTALCVVIVANRAAKKGKRPVSIGNAVGYAMSTAWRKPGSSYRAKGGPDAEGRKAEADVRRGMAARAAPGTPQAARATAEDIAKWNRWVGGYPPDHQLHREGRHLLKTAGVIPAEDRDG